MSSAVGRTLVTGLVLSAGLTSIASSQRSTSPVSSASRETLVGEWSGPIELDACTKTVAAVFRATDTTLAGTIYLDAEKFGEMEGVELTGNTVHFKVDQLDFTGVIEGTRMKVALIVYNGGTRNLTLRKVPDVRRGGGGAGPRSLSSHASSANISAPSASGQTACPSRSSVGSETPRRVCRRHME